MRFVYPVYINIVLFVNKGKKQIFYTEPLDEDFFESHYGAGDDDDNGTFIIHRFVPSFSDPAKLQIHIRYL